MDGVKILFSFQMYFMKYYKIITWRAHTVYIIGQSTKALLVRIGLVQTQVTYLQDRLSLHLKRDMLVRFLLCMYSSNGQVVDVFKTLFLKNSITSYHPTSLSKPFFVLQCLRGLHVCNFAAHIGVVQLILNQGKIIFTHRKTK